VQSKGNLKLHVSTTMQSKNHNKKHKTTPPPCIDKTFLKGKEQGEEEGKNEGE